MAMLIAIDHGNDSIKTENHRFRSGLTSHNARPAISDGVLEFGEAFYTLSNERIPYARDKTKDERFFLLTLFAVAKEIESQDCYSPVIEVDLAVGLPPEHFGPLKERFEAYFKRGSVKFVYDGRPYCIVIRHVIVCPQAYSAILAMDKEIGEQPRMFLIDGGGYTFDIGLLLYGKPDMKFNRSLEEGTITMYNEVARLVNADHNMLIDEDRILAVLQGKEVHLAKDPQLAEKVAHTIRTAAYEHAGDVLNKLRELKVDLRSNPAVFMGGAAELFKPVFESSDMVLDAQYNLDPKCNVLGYKLLARGKIQKLSQ